MTGSNAAKNGRVQNKLKWHSAAVIFLLIKTGITQLPIDLAFH